MRNLFRAFEAHRVRYLLISGQATVLYGAAQFSEDVDVWIAPTAANVRAFLRALAALKARVYKLTPPITLRHMRRGHGFHFIVPPRLHLDVMGQPPRVGSFASASRRAVRMKSANVVSIEDLVEIKKTNRPADYEVITNLALLRLQREPEALSWAVRNVFRAEDLWTIVERSVDAPPTPAVRVLRKARRSGRDPRASEWARVTRMLAVEAARLQHRGRMYWIPRLRELRRMRQRGELLPEGSPVTAPGP